VKFPLPFSLLGSLLLFTLMDEVRVVLLHDLFHIENDSILLGENACGPDPGTC
jgi:hypothetical protein